MTLRILATAALSIFAAPALAQVSHDGGYLLLYDARLHGDGGSPLPTVADSSGRSFVPGLQADVASGALDGGTHHLLDLGYENGAGLNRHHVAVASGARLGLLCIDGTPRRVILGASEPPPTRLRASFDSADGRHAEVVWDPSSDTQTVREVILDIGCWQLSFASDFLPLVSGDRSRNGGWKAKPPTEFTAPDAGSSSGTVEFEYWTQSAGEKGADAGTDFFVGNARVDVRVEPLPDIRWKAAQLAVAEGGTAGGVLLRSTVDDFVDETLQLLAEIAYERARARSFEIIKERLADALCDKLVMTQARAERVAEALRITDPTKKAAAAEALIEELRQSSATLKSGSDAGDPRLLPDTCALVASLRMEDVAASGESLLRVMSADLANTSLTLARFTATQAIKDDTKHAAVRSLVTASLRRLQHVAHQKVRGDKTALLTELQLLVLDMQRALLKDSKFETAGDCAALLAFATLTTCQERGGCDARMIAERIFQPERHFNLGQVCSRISWPGDSESKALAEVIRQHWPKLDQLVASGQALLNPPQGTTDLELLLMATSFSTDLIDGILVLSLPNASDAAEAENREKLLLVRAHLVDVRGVIDGINRADAQTAITSAVRLVERALTGVELKWKPPESDEDLAAKLDLERASRILGALTSYAQTYRAGAGSATVDPAALREVRKQALISLIDAATDRKDLGGAYVLTVGAPVGFGTYWGRAKARDGNLNYAQLTLPMGIGLTRLPGAAGQKAPCRYLGWHVQASLIDLGSYLVLREDALDEVKVPQWQSALSPGLQLGAAVGAPSDVFLVGVDIRYAPGLLQERMHSVRVGGFVAYYVPFLDLHTWER